MSSNNQHKDLKPIQHIINMQILREYEKNKMSSSTSDKNNLKESTDTAKIIAASVSKNEYAALVHRTIESHTLEQLNVI